MQTKEAVHLFYFEAGHIAVVAEVAIPPDDIPRLKVGPQLAKERVFIGRHGPMRRSQQGATVQGEQAQHAHLRETAALFLEGGLGISGLIFARVGHGQSRAIDQAKRLAPSQAAAARGRAFFQGLAQVAVDFLQVFQREAGAGLAIGAGVGIQFGGPGQAVVVGLEVAHRLAAGTARVKDLGEEGPKGNVERIKATAAVLQLGFGSQPAGWDEVGAKGLELAERGGAEALAGFEPGGLARLDFAEEEGVDKHIICIITDII